MTEISVIVLLQNNQCNNLINTINSLRGQTFKDFEIIIVGHENQFKCLKTQKDDEYRYVKIKTPNHSEARNAGAKIAIGKYLAFLDSHDILLPHHLECLSEVLEQDKNAGAAYGWHYWINQEQKPISAQNSNITAGSFPFQDSPWGNSTIRPAGLILDNNQIIELLKQDTLFLSNCLIRQECFNLFGPFSTDLTALSYLDFFANIIQSGYHLKCVRSPVVLIQLNPLNAEKDFEQHLSSKMFLLEKWTKKHRISESVESRNAIITDFFNQTLSMQILYGNDSKKSVSILKSAINHSPSFTLIQDNNILINWIADHCQYEKEGDPINNAENLFNDLGFPEKTNKIKKRVIGRIHVGNAFKNKDDRPFLAIINGIQAIFIDRRNIKNKGLIKILALSLLPEKFTKRFDKENNYKESAFFKKAARKKIFFISPHFDDAVLSCGGILAELSKLNADLTILTVFTEDQIENEPVSDLAKEIQSSWKLGDKPFAARKKEDLLVCQYLNCKYIWLGYRDVIYRYPNLRKINEFLVTNVSPENDICYENLMDNITGLIHDHPKALFFAPLGLGSHPDHLIIQHVFQSLRDSIPDLQVLFYEDFPYANFSSLETKLSEYKMRAHSIKINISKTLPDRVNLIKLYASQLESLEFKPDTILNIIEDYAKRIDSSGKPHERLWFFGKKPI